MRFTKQRELKKLYEEGATRTVRKFLFLPKTFDGETRWLEWANIYQVVDKVYAKLSWYDKLAYAWVDEAFCE